MAAVAIRAVHKLCSAKIGVGRLLRVLAGQSSARLHCAKRVLMMQAAEDRFHKNERIRRQTMAVFWTSG